MPRRIKSKNKLARNPIRTGALVCFLIVGVFGLYLLAQSYARGDPPPTIVKNPSFAYSCGYDFIFLIDQSYSQTEPLLAKNRKFATTFVNALAGSRSQFMVVRGGGDVARDYTKSASSAKNAIAGIQIEGGDDIDGLDRNLIDKYPGRKGKQKIIFIATDGQVTNTEVIPNDLKKSGVRIVVYLNTSDRDPVARASLLSGSRIDTGSIFTSDIILNSNYAKLAAQLSEFERKKSCDPPGNDDDNDDNSGGGSGNGNGNGSGGTGSGTNGNGSGGGGSSATKPEDKPKPVPKPSPQGTEKENPPEPEPSPFFDGKQYGLGSDPDAQTPADLVTNPNKALNNVWFYIVGIVLIIIIASFVLYKKRLWIFRNIAHKEN